MEERDMPKNELPERASLEYLRKLAKDRLDELRTKDPKARLSDAQLLVARDHGFASWRALKAEVDRRNADDTQRFLQACHTGDIATARDILDRDPTVVNARHSSGSTALHAALSWPELVRLLIERGADVNARDTGDNALPLHFAAAGASLAVVRLLIDAGSDVQGEGDDHKMDVIGWACCMDEARRDVIALLLERGARHNIFSAIACNDVEAVRAVVRRHPRELTRRLSRNEQEQTPVHYVVKAADGLVGGRFRTGEHYRTLEALIGLGADVNAKDAKGRTPLEIAMLQGDREAMRLLHQAGAKLPESRESTPRPSDLASSIGITVPMVGVRDMKETIAWYNALGFELAGSHSEEGNIGWAEVVFGKARIMLVPAGPGWRAMEGISLWIECRQLDDLYSRLKQAQMARSRAVLAGTVAQEAELNFTADLYTAFYGQREFGIRDPNGVEIMFWQTVSS
jgi:ankyrin repeat protein